MITLPNPRTKLWEQNNRSDVLGTMWSSFNLNLTDQLGKTKVSSRMMITTNGISQFGTPVAFREYGGKLYAMAARSTPSTAGTFVASTGLLRTPFVIESSSGGGATNFSSDYSDMEVFNSKLFVTGSDDALLYFDTSTWTAITSKLSSNINHKLLNFITLNRLYVSSTLTKVISCDTGFTFASSGSNTLQLGNTDVFITSLIQTPGLIWVLTVNQANNQGYVYTWDGVTADTVTSAIPLDSRGALAGIVKDNVPYIIDCDGKLMYYNGQTFVLAPNGRLPVKQFRYLKNPISLKNDRFIHPNGISLVDGRINILINNENYDNAMTIQENLPSGIWEYDPAIGWYHKNSLSQYDLTAITPTITDYGQNRLARVGALFNVKKDDNTSATTVGTFICGADYYTDNSTTKSASFINDSLDLIQKYGYLVTTKIFSSTPKQSWTEFFMRIRQLLTSTDKIVIKYRSDDIPATEIDITWVSSFIFTTTADISSYSKGDEVEGIRGGGSGRCAHIASTPSLNAGTYTVTIDDTLGQSSAATARVRLQKWKKLEEFSNLTKNIIQFSNMGNTSWVQIKAGFLFTGNDEMHDMLVPNTPYQ